MRKRTVRSLLSAATLSLALGACAEATGHVGAATAAAATTPASVTDAAGVALPLATTASGAVDIDVAAGTAIDPNSAVDLSGRAGTLATGGACSIFPARELTITRLSVVEDPVRTHWTGGTQSASDGAWSFGRIMAQMAGTQDPQDFVAQWLRTWQTTQVVNGIAVAPRLGINQMLATWPRDSKNKIDLTRAPMRLLAIVNRLDLRQPGQGSAGEVRLVYNVLNAQGQPQLFNVILEFNAPIGSGQQVSDWGAMWHALDNPSLSNDAFNQALQAITDRVTAANTAPGRGNGSSINHVRTNEIALDTSGAPAWELRQFEIGSAGLLAMTPVAMTPDTRLNRSRNFVDFVNANQNAILALNYSVPATFEGGVMQGGSSINIPFAGARAGQAPTMRPPAIIPWQFTNPFISSWMGMGIANAQARNIASLNTCNGCHGSETEVPFMQIFPRQAGSEAQLSAFLTGEVVPDPMFPFQIRRTYVDLQRRAQDLAGIVCGGNTANNNGSGLVVTPR